MPHPYILAVTWPWSKCVRIPLRARACACCARHRPGLTCCTSCVTRSGEFYVTDVPVNATQAPVWQQSFTFDQSNNRARKVALWLRDATVTDSNGVSAPRDGDPSLGLAMVPVPSPGTQAVSVTDRATGEPSADIVEGWWPIRGPPRTGEADYEHADAPAIGEVYARVSFAERRGKSGYCEQVHLQEPVAQPVDSYSNFGFLLSGTHMLAVCVTDGVRLRAGGRRAATLSAMQLFPVFSCANGLTQYFVGAGSFLFHASMTEVGQNLDMSGVYMLLGTPMLYLAMRLGFLGPPHRRLTHVTFFVLTTVGSFVLYQYRRDLEAPAGGSTNLVLLMIALLAGLTGAWLWLVGNAPEERRLSMYDDDLDALLAMSPSPSMATLAFPDPLDTPPPTHTHTHPLLRAAHLQLRRLGWAVNLAVFPTKERQARSSEVMLVSAEAAEQQLAGQCQASPEDAVPAASSPLASPRYLSRQERLAAALMALKARSKPSGMRYRYCVASVLCIGVAYAARQMDVKFHVACYPTGWFQLHAVWHILAAGSLYFLWVFMRCEAPPTHPGGGTSMTVTPRATAGGDAGSLEMRMVMPEEGHLEDRLMLLGASSAATGASSVMPLASTSAAVDAGRAASPRGGSLFSPRSGLASATVDLVDLRSPRSRAASMLDVAGGSQGSMLSGGRDSSGGDADADAVVGFPAGTARAAAHLRTRSREVVFGHDMV